MSPQLVALIEAYFKGGNAKDKDFRKIEEELKVIIKIYNEQRPTIN